MMSINTTTLLVPSRGSLEILFVARFGKNARRFIESGGIAIIDDGTGTTTGSRTWFNLWRSLDRVARFGSMEDVGGISAVGNGSVADGSGKVDNSEEEEGNEDGGACCDSEDEKEG